MNSRTKIPEMRLVRTTARDRVLGLALWLAVSPMLAAQTLEIIEVPNFRHSGNLSGRVSGVDPAQYKVSIWIKPDGVGWWPKPNFDNLDVPIDPSSGNFSADIGSGDLDTRATWLCALLLPIAQAVPATGDLRRIPRTLTDAARDIDCAKRSGRTLEFADRTWAVKDAPLPVGPGSNRFTDDSADVFVDTDGRLHLKIVRRADAWWSSQVYLLESLGYGTYVFETDYDIDALHSSATLGLFVWDEHGDAEHYPHRDTEADNREIDLEHGRWGRPADSNNAQWVVMPYTVPGNRERFRVPTRGGSAKVTQWFTWTSESIEFGAAHGTQDTCTLRSAELIMRARYLADPDSDHFVPVPGRETVQINLWLNSAISVDAEPIEVVISDFRFRPLDDPDCSSGARQVPMPIWALLVGALLVIGIARPVRLGRAI